MAKTAMIRARTEPGLKKSVDQILHQLGLNESEAINIFFNQIKMQNGLPFEVRIPNTITKATFESTDKNKNIKKFTNKKDLFNSLNI